MSLVPLVNPVGSFFLIPKIKFLSPKISTLGFSKPSIFRDTKPNSRVWCSNPSKETGSEEILDEKELPILRRWDVPWDWKVTALVMMPYVMSIVFTGVVESSRLAGVQHPYSENTLSQLDGTDEQAIKMFMDQLLKSMVKLSVLYMFVRPYQPLPDDLFSLKWREPLNLWKGWILWAGSGLLIASSAIFLLKFLLSSSDAGQAQNETESLARLLPLIGLSNVSTVCLLAVLGILAPISEEILYRGFLLTSLTKWFPLPLSVFLSSAVFTFGHQSPGKSLEIFIFGEEAGARAVLEWEILRKVLARDATRNFLRDFELWKSRVILLVLGRKSHKI